MFTWLGQLAAVARSAFVKVKACLLAVSFLTVSLLLTGCSGLLDPSGGSRLLQALADILKLLPESVPTTPLEIFEMVFGEAFAETFEQWMMFIVYKPDIEGSIFGIALHWLTFIIFLLIAVYLGWYLVCMAREMGKIGVDNVLEGRSDEVISPIVYIPYRYLPVLVIVISGPLLVQGCINFTWKIVTDFADAMYFGAGSSIGTVMFDLVVGMLEGAKVWVFLGMLVVVAGGGIVAIAVLTWRYLIILLNTVRMVVKVPRYLGGQAMSHDLTEPIMTSIKGVAILGITWLVILLGPLGITEMNINGTPAVIALFIYEVLVIAAPFIIIGIGGSLTSKISTRVRNSVRRVDTHNQRMSPERRASVAQQAWGGVKGAGRVAVEVGKLHPKAGPVIMGVERTVQAVSRRDSSEIAQVITRAPLIRDQFKERSSPAVQAVQVDPTLSRLINLAKSSPFRAQQHLDDAVFALCVEMASSSSDISQDEIRRKAVSRTISMNPEAKSGWARLGREIKKVV